MLQKPRKLILKLCNVIRCKVNTQKNVFLYKLVNNWKMRFRKIQFILAINLSKTTLLKYN